MKFGPSTLAGPRGARQDVIHPSAPASILSLLSFAETVGDQRLQRLQRFDFVRAVRFQEDA